MRSNLKGIVLWIFLYVFVFCMTSASAETDLYFINVGKGDAILIRTDGYTCLVDSGKKNAETAVQAAFEKFGIDYLDAVFLTHTDKDHSGGFQWLDSFPIGAVYTSPYSTKKPTKNPADKLANSLGIDCIRPSVGDEISLGNSGMFFRILAPSLYDSTDEDENSLVMMLDGPDGKVLLTGDMEMAETSVLLESGVSLKCDLLKVPNHGDDDACPYELIEACSPCYAVISTSSEDKPGTPSEKVLNNLQKVSCNVLVTQDYEGGIGVRMDHGTITVDENF